MLLRFSVKCFGPDAEIREMFSLMKCIRNLENKLDQLEEDDQELASFRAAKISDDIERYYRKLDSNPQYEDEEFCWELFDACADSQ